MPNWTNPANCRKTPYTNEEIEGFVNDFIKEFPKYYKELEKKDGPIVARIILRESFKSKDENRR